jgi:glycosyltransferase involved in cell wall biosynthesis
MSKNRFVVIIPSYNNKDWYKKNLNSVIKQKYDNYRILYTDDCSPDGTGQLVEDFIKEKNINNIILIKNTSRLRAMNNIYNMVHSCDDEEIIVVLDGDDWLAHDLVLNRLDEEYNKSKIWMTYGQFKEYPSESVGCSRSIPQFVKDNGSYRKYRWCSSHLRTFYTWLFKKIKKEDLQYNGEFFSMSNDLAIMFPMLEMAGNNQSFISDILYVYNCQTPLNDCKIDINKQQGLEFYIRSRPCYSKIGV